MAAKLSGPGGEGRYTVGQNADMNVTPMVDVMLVLLIIFMVAAPLATVSIKLDLPPSLPPPPGQKPKPPTVISLQKSGAIFLKDKQTDADHVAADLQALIGPPGPNAEAVFIRSDKEVKYNTFMTIVNALQEGGYYKIALITEDLA